LLDAREIGDFCERGEHMRLPAEQEAIRAKCFHPARQFVEFSKEQIEQSIPKRFAEIVRRHPKRLAVKAGAQELRIDELNQLADRVAHAIISRCGVGNSTVVVLIKQGIDLLTGILGALKAGKCFALAELSWPREKLTAILEDSKADLIVTNDDGAELVRELISGSRKSLNVNQLVDSISGSNVRLDVSPDSLGYLVYTSGSTGKPKGVFQNQRNILHGVMRRINGFRIEPEDRLTLLSSGGHQAIMNIFSAVLSGAAIFPFDPREHSPAEFTEWLQREGITIYHSSASLFRQLATTLRGNEKLPSIRLVRSASEAALQSDVDLYRKHFSDDCIFCNGMGSTETGTSAFISRWATGDSPNLRMRNSSPILKTRPSVFISRAI
jgi:non-ribosomal peptide synthetase component F